MGIAIDTFISSVGTPFNPQPALPNINAQLGLPSIGMLAETSTDEVLCKVDTFDEKLDAAKLKAQELSHAIKVCEKVIDAGSRAELKPPHLQQALQNLAVTQETSVKLEADASFFLKFRKKMTSGEPCTIDSLIKVTDEMANAIMGLAGDCRVVKAHIPRKTGKS